MLKLEIDISVLITCYSEGKLIFDAVNSILNQSLSAKEIIIVNDASQHQETIEVCKTLEQEPQIQVIWRKINGGTSASRNDGFAAAKGEIIVPLDADDILPQNALELIWNAFKTHPDTGFIYGNYIRQNQANLPGVVVDPGEISLKNMLDSKAFSLSSQWKLIGTTPLRRSLWESVGGYDTDFGVEDLHDVEFWIQAIASGCAYFHIPDTIYIWRKYLGRNSRRVMPLAWYRVVKKHFDIYCHLGLNYRAYELLLLGAKWLNNSEEIRLYSQQLISCIKQGKFKVSTLTAMAIPTPLFQFLAKRAAKGR